MGRLLVADTPQLKEAVYRIRHRVYCEEFGYEPLSSDFMEKDEYDEHSVHYLWENHAACVRVVTGDKFPFEKVYQYWPPSGSFGEISRLAILPEYRLSSVAPNLYLALIDELDLEHAVALMEKRLARHLRMYGLRPQLLASGNGPRSLYLFSR